MAAQATTLTFNYKEVNADKAIANLKATYVAQDQLKRAKGAQELKLGMEGAVKSERSVERGIRGIINALATGNLDKAVESIGKIFKVPLRVGGELAAGVAIGAVILDATSHIKDFYEELVKTGDEYQKFITELSRKESGKEVSPASGNIQDKIDTLKEVIAKARPSPGLFGSNIQWDPVRTFMDTIQGKLVTDPVAISEAKKNIAELQKAMAAAQSRFKAGEDQKLNTQLSSEQLEEDTGSISLDHSRLPSEVEKEVSQHRQEDIKQKIDYYSGNSPVDDAGNTLTENERLIELSKLRVELQKEQNVAQEADYQTLKKINEEKRDQLSTFYAISAAQESGDFTKSDDQKGLAAAQEHLRMLQEERNLISNDNSLSIMERKNELAKQDLEIAKATTEESQKQHDLDMHMRENKISREEDVINQQPGDQVSQQVLGWIKDTLGFNDVNSRLSSNGPMDKQSAITALNEDEIARQVAALGYNQTPERMLQNGTLENTTDDKLQDLLLQFSHLQTKASEQTSPGNTDDLEARKAQLEQMSGYRGGVVAGGHRGEGGGGNVAGTTSSMIREQQLAVRELQEIKMLIAQQKGGRSAYVT